MVVGRLLSYWEGNFSGAMLNFGRVPMTVTCITCRHAWLTSRSSRGIKEMCAPWSLWRAYVRLSRFCVLKNGPLRLFRLYRGLHILPSYMGNIISHDKDPYKPTSIMESNRFFLWLMSHFAHNCRCGRKELEVNCWCGRHFEVWPLSGVHERITTKTQTHEQTPTYLWFWTLRRP